MPTTLEMSVANRHPDLFQAARRRNPNHDRSIAMTRDLAINTARYGMAVWRRQLCLFARLHRAIQAIQLASGLAAVATLVQTSPPWLSAVAGALIAATVVVDFVFRPADTAATARDNLMFWSDLQAKVHDVKESELQRMINDGWKRPDLSLSGLRNVAYNDVLDERGYPDQRIELTRWQSLLRSIS